MIVIKATGIIPAVKQAYNKLLVSGSDNSSDPSILKEDAAVIEITSSQLGLKGFSIHGDRFVYEENYGTYFPRVDKELIRGDELDFSRLFLATKSIDAVIDYIKRIPDSRRSVINVWSPTYLDPAIPGACITQLYFRLRDGRLELHSHSRANDAYRLLLLDMQLASCIHHEAASRLGVEIGTYIHFSDSLHLYKRHTEDIAWQQVFMGTADAWQA